MTNRNTEFFPKDLQDKLRNQFYFLDSDLNGNKRIFFENAGGALRLKSAVEKYVEVSKIPDSPVRDYDIAQMINQDITDGKKDISMLLNAEGGEIAISLTASKIMFEMITVAAINLPKGNIVTTSIEHPSSYDACEFSSQQYGHELRVAKADQGTGSVFLEELLSHIDEETRIVSLILTSNITGGMHDLKKYTQAIHERNSEAIIIVDAVQGAPHELIDLSKCHVDGINIAPYKMFGLRGVGFAWLSNRLACMPHHRLLATAETNWDLGSATPAHYASFSKIVDYICEIGMYYIGETDRRTLIEEGMNRIKLQEQAILNRLLNGSETIQGTKQLNNVMIHFEKENGIDQDLILAMTFSNISNNKAVEVYKENSIQVFAREASSHYSKRILESVGLDSLVRVSPIHVHNSEDVDEFLRVTKIINNM
ncbi:cysteine desulfurase [Jeotgalicoccus coquinae]|uniref:Cysteine desulfurase IscS n=1 Tax=Jeotgalicoccus coquinae TaxID=709509 RepID=A0A6V7RQS2_9STAP|nr:MULTISPECIES: aminotransferase class V-fold PLP-dependent enzyme [Staphylococcaceae]MBB6423958.1 selenocysteine lyase/cysteine desulfurase [Jeotgalicoccus coquinae]GGE23638.1 cysteine desulfurase [Jeotgalicoccus coquinae]CAD2080292.1 Cysteine desulfurase IscS [Jeotgalicoccus coquinae]